MGLGRLLGVVEGPTLGRKLGVSVGDPLGIFVRPEQLFVVVPGVADKDIVRHDVRC